jgi:hypothetical protein
MSSVTISYLPGTVPATDMDVFASKVVKDQVITLDLLREAFDNYIGNYQSGTLADIRLNFYSLLGIPENSYIYDTYQPLLNTAVLNSVFKKNGILHPVFVSPSRIVVNQHLVFRYNVGKPNFPGAGINKIHLQAKHEYILHCVLKLVNLAAEFPSHEVQWKFHLWNRDSNLLSGDTTIRDINGGVAGTIVIYGSSDTLKQTKILSYLLRMFPNHEEMGLMDIRDTSTLTAGHIRLNKLISYAGTDRGTLIDRLQANMKTFPAIPTRLPPWLKELTTDCDNDASQLHIGMNACDADSKPIDYEALCNTGPRTKDQGYCYMPTTLLDPRIIRSAGGSRARFRHTRRRKTRRALRRNGRI